jgi:uncharacterized protein YdhG (YjbR/CyaY superfamily)
MSPASIASNDAVGEYIARAPAEVRAQLEQVRSTIRAVAPGAVELVSYRMPGYAYPGYSGGGVFVWFALFKTHISLFLRVPTVADHRKELANYQTTKSAVHLPLDQKIPGPLIRKLVRASIRIMKQG